jgi:hypothetical protein
LGDENDYVVLDGGRVIGRIFLHPQAPERSSVVLDNNRSGYSAVNRQAGLFSNARTSDGGFQGAMDGDTAVVIPLVANPNPATGRPPPAACA